MPIKQCENTIALVKLEVAPAEIPELLKRSDYDPPRVPYLEGLAENLVRDGFPPVDSQFYVEQVTRWGRGHRLLGRVMSKNTAQEIARALRSGFDGAMAGDPAEGVERICRLNHLAQSFASKQLRFLVPSRVVIMDSVIRERLGYPESVDGYRAFLRDCHEILRLTKLSVQLSTEVRASLRVCDIESAIYAKLQGY